MPLVAVTPHTVVITAAKTGPDRTIPASTFTNVTGIALDLVAKRLFITVDTATVMNPLAAPTANPVGDNTKEIDLALTTAITVAIAAGVYTVTIA